MIFVRCNLVDAPDLTEREVSSLESGETVEKRLDLKAGDMFAVGSGYVFVKFELNGVCKLRRMTDAEIGYAAGTGRSAE